MFSLRVTTQKGEGQGNSNGKHNFTTISLHRLVMADLLYLKMSPSPKNYMQAKFVPATQSHTYFRDPGTGAVVIKLDIDIIWKLWYWLRIFASWSISSCSWMPFVAPQKFHQSHPRSSEVSGSNCHAM